jgi:hypothetical protein
MAFLNWLLKHITLLAHLTVDEGFVDVDLEVAWHSIPLSWPHKRMLISKVPRKQSRLGDRTLKQG